MQPSWWTRPRRISVVVDNPSWIVRHARDLVDRLVADGDDARFCSSADEVASGGIAFYLGCIHITPKAILERNHRNLVVHESDLPHGRGFSPLTWQVLHGASRVTVCLLEAAAEVDAGPVIYRDALEFAGHELVDELRAAQGKKTVELCRRFLNEKMPMQGDAQSGTATHYRKRRPEDSRLDPLRTIADQFNLLRVVDNERYPAFFDLLGQRYRVRVEKLPAEGPPPAADET